jgi:hypothetical protein
MGNPEDDRKHDLNWQGYDPEKVREMFNLGQAYLGAQLQTALAADSRAMSMAGLFVTLALAILAAGLGYWQTNKDSWAVLLPALTAAGLLVSAGAQAGWAARPIVFYLPGTHPEQLFKCRGDDLATMLGGQAEIDDRDIRRNERCMAANARAVMRAFWIAVAAPVAAFGVWLIIVLFFEGRWSISRLLS